MGCQADLSLFSHLTVMMMLILMLMMTCVHESSVTVITNSLDHHPCFPGCLDVMVVCWTRVRPLTIVITEPVAVCVYVYVCGHGILRMTP